MLAPLGILVVILGVAFLIETLTEAVFGPIFDKVEKLTPYKWAMMYIAILAGIIGAFVYQFDLVAILASYASQLQKAVDPEIQPVLILPGWFGMFLTGLAIGKGSNYLHQFISTFFPAKPPPKA